MEVSNVAHSLTESMGLSPGQAKRLEELLDNYLRSLEQGQHPDRERIIRDHPDLADALDANLTKLDALHRALLNLGDSPVPFEEFFLGEFPEARNLGDFRLIREIGRGGMGVVYEAEQLTLGRRVAVKVLPFAAVLDQRQLRRFKSEAQAAALLRHPNIVGVLAVGCERGVHYYAMELVEGWSLAQVIEHMRQQRNDAMGDRSTLVEGSREADAQLETPVPPQRKPDVYRESSHLPTSEPRISLTADTAPIASLSTEYSREKHEFHRSVARLGIQSAEALEYAHQEGVVHRDVKPSNLLLDTLGKLWITDFGLAQVQDTHNLTTTGDVLGTLRYMSPEQAAGRKLLDNRTDIYSLGITLYELLTLRHAFPGDNRQELLKRIESAEPPAPRKLDATIPRDLETVVLKAISKDAANRYGTAAELADDLQRFLDQKPIQARRSRPLHQLWRLARRNPAFTGFVAATVFLLALAAVGGWAMAVRQSALVDEMGEIRAASERSRRDLQQMVDRTLEQTGIALASMQPHERGLLKDMCDYYHRLRRERGNDPNIRYEVATGLYRCGQVYQWTDQSARGHELVQESLDLLSRLESEYPSEQRYAFDLARSHYVLAKPRIMGIERAFGHYRRSIELLEELVSAHGDEPKYARLLSYCRGTYGSDLLDAGRVGEAEEQTQLAAALSQELVNEFGDQEDVGRLGWSKFRLFTLHMFCHRFDEAERMANDGLAMEDRLDNSFWRRTPQNVAGRATYYKDLAQLMMCLQRPQHAELHLREAIEYGDELARAYPHFGWGLGGLASAHQLLGDVLLCLERGPEARDAMNESLRRWQERIDAVPGPDYQESMAWTHYKLGELLWWTGQKKDARVNFIEARTRFETLPSKHRDDLLFSSECDSLLARILIVCPDRQMRDPRRGLVLAKQRLKPEVGASWQLLGTAHYRNGEWQQAIDALTRCMEMSQDGDAFDWLLLAMAHWQLEQQTEACGWYERAREAIDRKLPLSLQNFSHPFHLRELLKEAESLMGIEHAT